MKCFLTGFVLCVVISTPALAQQQDGPFASTSDLVNYWSMQNTGGSAVQIFVNGSKVYERFGFGPGYVGQYFNCADGSGIKAKCNSIFDGYVNANDAMGTFGSGLTVYLDGALYRSGSPYYTANITTCYGDASFYGAVRYYIVASMFDGFGPQYPGNHCY